MIRTFQCLAASILAVGVLWLGGCGASPEGGENAGGDAAHTKGSMHDEHEGMDMHHDAAQDGDQDANASKIEKGLAELSEADRALAEKQKTCPVSDQPLGMMGKPLKLEIEGREVFLCCPNCEDPIRKEPDKYLAKLDGEK